jgi:hypothetical protein
MPQSLVNRIGETAALELAPTALTLILGLILLVAIVKGARQRGSTRATRCVVVVICVLEFAFFRYLFPETSVTRGTLEEPGVIVDALEQLPEGSRVLGPGGNLLMILKLAPVQAYRTLDVPLPPPVAAALRQLDQTFPQRIETARSDPATLLGIEAVLRAPLLTPQNQPAPSFDSSVIIQAGDPLAAWLDGPMQLTNLLRSRGLRIQTALQKRSPPPPALVLSAATLTIDANGEAMGLYGRQPLRTVGRAEAIGANDRRTWKVQIDEPGYLVVGSLFTPGWSARVKRNETWESVPVLRVDRYWQAIPLTGVGQYAVELSYLPPGLIAGGITTSIAALLWLMTVAVLWWKQR